MESKRNISVEETIQLTEDDIRSLRTYEWSGSDCIPAYALPVDITWKYAFHCFQLDPAPMEKEENWYINAACEHNELKYILFFLHYYEKKLNNLIRRALIGTRKYHPEIFLDVKCSCLETVFKKYLDYDPKQNTKFSTYLYPFIRDTILFFKMQEEAWTISSLTVYKTMRSMASIYHKHNGNCAKAIEEFSQKARCSTKIAQLYLNEVRMLRMRQDYSISYENEEGESSSEEVVEDAGWLEFGTLWNFYSNDNVQNAFWKLRYRDQLLIEKRNALCMSCGRIGMKKERYSYEQLSALIQASTDKGAEKAYKKALENLLVQLIEDRAMRAVRIKRKNQKRRKQKIAAATYLYQADCDGEWGEIRFDFEKGTAEIISLADWDTTISRIFAKEVIAYLLRCKNEDLPEETLRVLEW